VDAFFVGMTLSDDECELQQRTPNEEHEQEREHQIDHISVEVHLQQCILFGGASGAKEQKAEEKEEEEEDKHIGACLYCGDTGPQGLGCQRCEIDGMVYEGLVDSTYRVPEYNDDTDDEEESESESGEEPPAVSESEMGTSEQTSETEGEEEKETEGKEAKPAARIQLIDPEVGILNLLGRIRWAYCAECRHMGNIGSPCEYCDDGI